MTPTWGLNFAGDEMANPLRMINLYFLIVVVMPTVVGGFVYYFSRPRRFKDLYWGAYFGAFASLGVGMGVSLIRGLESVSVSNPIEMTLKTTVLNAAGVWTFGVSVIILGVASNLLSDFLKKKE